MEMIDLLFEQIEKDSKNKVAVRHLADRLKLIMSHAMPAGSCDINISPDLIIESVRHIRTQPVKAIKCTDISMLKEMLLYQCVFYGFSNRNDRDIQKLYVHYMLNYDAVYNELLAYICN